MDLVVGILAGGQSVRMGGGDKTRLPAPDTGEPLLSRLLRIAGELRLPAVTVGGVAVAGVDRLSDAPADVGPLGGLCALLTHAGDRPAIALAGDLPYLEPGLLARLARAPSVAAVLAPRDFATGKWQPFFARYDARRVLPTLLAAIGRGDRSFQAVFRDLDVEELALDDPERAQLRDWDTPGDLPQ